MKKKELSKSLQVLLYLSISIPFLAGIIVSVLSFVPDINITDEYTVSTLLIIMSAIAAHLIFVHKTSLKVDSSLTKIVDLLNNPSANDVILPFGTIRDELRDRFEKSEEIWFLTRTARGWIKSYNTELERKLKNKNIQFIVINPANNLTCEIVVRSSVDEWDSQPDVKQWIKNYREFLNRLKGRYSDGQDTLDLRTIDYLPAYTLIFINYNYSGKDPIIYVELAKYISGSNDRPVFRVTPQDKLLYKVFSEEFFEIRKNAKPF